MSSAHPTKTRRLQYQIVTRVFVIFHWYDLPGLGENTVPFDSPQMRTGASLGQNMSGGQTWRARAYNGTDPPDPL